MTLAKSNKILAEYGLSVAQLNDPDNTKRKQARNKLKGIFELRTTVKYKTKSTKIKTNGKDTSTPGRIMPNARLAMFLTEDSGEFIQIVRSHAKKGVAKSVMPINETKTVEIEQGKKEIAELEAKLTDNETDVKDESPVFSSAVAENLAKDNNVDATELKGTGKDGKITKKDVQDFIDNAPVIIE